MKKYEIMVDAYGTRRSKCFHKVVEAENEQAAEKYADRWCDLLQGNNYEFYEWDTTGIEEYTGAEHEVGDYWEDEIEHDKNH